MTNTEKILAYLQSISPREATNDEIVRGSLVRPHQQVFQITQRLLSQGTIAGSRAGGIWRFRVKADGPTESDHPPAIEPEEAGPGRAEAARAFESLAQRVMSDHYETTLTVRKLVGVPKLFDFVSEDGRIVGDAKFFTLVGGHQLPPAKFSVIAEHVWLLEKTGSPQTFLVFGNDRRVPLAWLKRYQSLAGGVQFYFLDESGNLECLTEHAPVQDHIADGGRDSELERAFHREMEHIYAAALAECNYRATRFLQEVQQKGGLAAAKALLHKPGISEGLTALWECGRLDLSMEQLILTEPWANLFTKEERTIARTRLQQLGGKGP